MSAERNRGMRSTSETVVNARAWLILGAPDETMPDVEEMAHALLTVSETLSDHSIALTDRDAEIVRLREACQRYFDATSELRTEATFHTDEAEREYADAYNALYELVSPKSPAMCPACGGLGSDDNAGFWCSDCKGTGSLLSPSPQGAEDV